jgi:beta-glucosidase
MSDAVPRAEFPKDFLWGAATSAYQIEGSPLADGAGPSIWHRFSREPGRIVGGDTADVACDHYRRYREDVEIMERLGLGAYRMSLAWARIFPEGSGAVNQKGLDFYRGLIDLLLERGIQPFITLYHWDLPAALEDRSGWLHPDSAGWFADYARTVFRALGDRVSYWTTLNEPWVVADAGYLHGVHAPGRRDVLAVPRASLHLLRAHAAAVQVFRAECHGRIGLVVNLEPKDPASDSDADRAAARRADVYMNHQYLDPVFRGRYPEEMADVFGEAWPSFSPEDLRGIDAPLDFLGINYYSRSVVRHDPTALPPRVASVRSRKKKYTDLGWEIHPESLTRTLRWVKERYGDIPLYVTENGAAFPEPSHAPEETFDDPLRVEYLRRHLLALRQALWEGVDVRGYFVWSLLDNFEWGWGRSKRFGIVHVDLESQRRTPKTSASFYRDVIRSRGESLDAVLRRTP